MDSDATARRLLDHETRALMTRVDQVRPFVLQMPMVLAASISPAAQSAIEALLIDGRRRLRGMARGFLRWLHGAAGRRVQAPEAQRRFTHLRMRFNALLTQFDIFSDVLCQRSEHGTGVWAAGLDDLAQDALRVPGIGFEPPPVVCYLDRGVGAAIRRARTRLPGGEVNPCSVIRVPRERLVGSGIASSVVHEVGHAAADLLRLLPSLRPVLRGMQATGGGSAMAWRLWELWISEIVADFWSVARVGVGSTLGLMGVVSLPRAFIFRIVPGDPHPFPWIRVRLSCAIGRALYPDPQWDHLAQVWASLYPPGRLSVPRRRLFEALERTMPGLVSILVHHRPRSLRGRTLAEALDVRGRAPERLRALHAAWAGAAARMRGVPPSLVFAVVGQARADGTISPEEESRTLSGLLTYWAVSSSLEASAACARRPKPRVRRAAFPAAAIAAGW